VAKKRNILLYPLSLIYGIVTEIRNFLYNSGIFKSVEFRIPIICVGNITVGGTGKTPHTEYLIALLKDKFRVATLSRGYKRKSKGFRIAGKGISVIELGDEPMQMYLNNPDITITVDRDRINGVSKILSEKPETEVIILDDGFQHRRLKPGYSILLTDYNRLMIRDNLLPYGELRETIHNMDRADIILITKTPPNLSPIQRRIIVKEINKAAYQNLFFTTFSYKKPVKVFPSNNPTENPFTESEKNKSGILLVTGIVNPAPLKEYLEQYSAEIIHLPFPDHHKFSERDILKISDAFASLLSVRKSIITTEKDAVRLREFTNIADNIKSSFYYIPIGIEFLNDDKEEFDNLIIEYVRKNKRNNRISESQRV
jgi:tetraacyldisaccharide 4'-kinase